MQRENAYSFTARPLLSCVSAYGLFFFFLPFSHAFLCSTFSFFLLENIVAVAALSNFCQTRTHTRSVMRSSSNSRTPATDFVQDYAAKRQAQMDRARQLREERLQQQQQQQVSSPSGGDGASNIGSPAPMLTPLTGSPGSASSRPPPHVPRSRHPSSGHVHAAAAAGEDDGRVLYVKESDFKQATQAGIITPDQARQLWAMLSNQIIRVCPPSGQGNSVSQTNNNTVSVSSLMALSHHSSASSDAGRNSASGNGGNFGASISLESLRNSIAFFKREQQRLKQQQQQQQGNAAVTRPASSSKVIAAAAPSAPSQQQHRSAYEKDEDEDEEVEFHEEADHYAEEEQRQRHQLRGGGGGGRGSSRPAWNSDVEINYGDDATAASSSAGGVAARKKARTASTAKVTSAARPTVGAGGGGGSKASPSSASSDSAQVRNAGVGAGGRPQANRSAAANNNQNTSRGTPLNLDDVPVGGGGGGGGMNDWANAYPPGMAPPDSRDGNKVSSSSGGAGFTVPAASENDVIAAEAAAAAREPMKECATCGRTFRVSVLARHEALCRKQANKPRKVFNTRDQRLDGVEGINEVQRAAPRNANANANTRGGRGGGGGADAAAKGKLPKWKVQHEQFQAAMRAVRQQNEGGGGRFGNGALAPPPAPIPEQYDDRVPCPHCGRKFADEVAARHIPKCATTVAKPKGIRPIRR